MAPKTKASGGNPFSLLSLLQFSLGLLFFLRGIRGITVFNTPSSEVGQALSRALGGNTAVLELLIILIELGCGAVIIASYVIASSPVLRRRFLLAVTIVWAVLMLLFDILLPNFHSRFFDWLLWGQQVSFNLIVLISLLMVRKSAS